MVQASDGIPLCPGYRQSFPHLESTRMSAPRVRVKRRPLFPEKLKPGRLLSTTVTPAVLRCGDARPMRRSGEGMWRIHCLTGGVCSGC